MTTLCSRLLAAAALALSAFSASATDVRFGVSIDVARPGVYGRVDIGRYPAPVIVQTVPVPVHVVHRQPVYVEYPEPVPLWVPPGHQKKWHKHCHRYNACGVPVAFVDPRWARHQGLCSPGYACQDGRQHGRWYGKGRGRDRDAYRYGDDRDD